MRHRTPSSVGPTCFPCRYYCHSSRTCDYYLITKMRRESPAGENCDKFAHRGDERKRFGSYVWYTPSIAEQMRVCYERGLSDFQIGKTLGIAPYHVSEWRNWNRLPSQAKLRKEAETDWI